MMKYRRLGRTELMVSQVGFGTCQLRMVPRQQALDTLRRGFELGVNIIHTAADYGGAIEIVAEAVRDAPQPVYVCSNGWGQMEAFGAQFEQSLALFGRRSGDGRLRLDVFGIASVEDRIILHDDVWGDQGQVAFLQRKKREGVLGHTFCTTHGSPAFIAELIRSGAFDAVMFAYNALGHHALSYLPPPGRDREDVAGNAALFQLAAEHDIGVLLMEVLGGGLMCASKAFDDRVREQDSPPSEAKPVLRSTEVLTHLLRTRPQAASLLPGTASIEEAEENALAGHESAPAGGDGNPHAGLLPALEAMRGALCTRCGACEPLCSKKLPISWLFRASDIERTGAVSFETPLGYHYFDLHAESPHAACTTCSERSCRCEVGIDIPAQLATRHDDMLALRRSRATPGATSRFDAAIAPQWAAELMSRAVNGRLLHVAVRNVGWHGWHRGPAHTRVCLVARYRTVELARPEIADDVPAGAVMYCGIALQPDIPAGEVALFLAFSHPDGACAELELNAITTHAPADAASPESRWRSQFLAPTDLGVCTPGQQHEASLQVRNTGQGVWEAHSPVGQSVTLLLRVADNVYHFLLPHDVAPGEAVGIPVAFRWPTTAGSVQLRAELVKQNVAFFTDLGSEPLVVEVPSAAPPVYAVDYLDCQFPKRVRPRAHFGVWLRVRNTGSMSWPCGTPDPVVVTVRINGELTLSAELPHAVARGQTCDLHLVVPAPARTGPLKLALNFVHHCVAYFGDNGVADLETDLVAEGELSPDAHLFDVAGRSNWAFYHPTAGVSMLADGTTLPRFLDQARGPHVWDTSGRRFIDYTIGWGCALLGHGNDIVESAVRRSMRTGPTLPLPHRVEMELTDALCQPDQIPCAEMVAFGKNGSDVCSLAVRLARICTGRRTVLVCGYHGWQDWYAEPLGFGGTGVPERSPPLVIRVESGRLDRLLQHIQAHHSDLAAVMLEPAGASGGPCMVAEDADPGQLAAVAHATRAAGALLIFDEIITGFRYRQGSVQKATGVVPDLACFGKALANGFPLSALVGRATVMRELARCFYGPTFKGEVYALAAALASLRIYRAEPVADHVWRFGESLQQGLRQACAEAEVAAIVAGPPFRFVLHFDAPDTLRRRLLRTLYLQELLRGGVITYAGVMLPSYAHRAAELEQTLSVATGALRTVARHARHGDEGLHRAIEMPLLAAEA
jgi:glutamate-1-semialdehyde 2,1-aminomutase